MENMPKCPKCGGEYVYEDGPFLICPECSYEWREGESSAEQATVIKDSNGNILADGDTVTVIKDLKIKGSSSVIKVGTKAKNIRLLPDSSDGHDLDCKVDGFGAMKLKSEFVKKA